MQAHIKKKKNYNCERAPPRDIHRRIHRQLYKNGFFNNSSYLTNVTHMIHRWLHPEVLVQDVCDLANIIHHKD